MLIQVTEKEAISVISVKVQAGRTEYKFLDQYLFKDRKIVGIYASNDYINNSDVDNLQKKARLNLLETTGKWAIDGLKVCDLRTYATAFQIRSGKIAWEKSTLILETPPTPSEIDKVINLIVVYEK